MAQRTGRFNYLANNPASPERAKDTERFEYRHIIDQLTREHQYQNHLKDGAESRRVCSPVRNAVQKGKEENGTRIRSIILNQVLQTEKANPEKGESGQAEVKDVYRLIKESHIMNDDEIDKMCENFNSLPRVQRAPIVKTPPTPPQRSVTPLRFYEIKQTTPDRSHSKTPKKIQPKNNEPYVSQALSAYPPPEKRSEYPPFTPSRVAISESQLKRSNRAYKAQRPQIAISQRWQQPQPPFQPPPPSRKRSCYDYVPEQMKSKLSKPRPQY